MTVRDVQGWPLAQASRIDLNYISTLRSGTRFPLPATAARIAQVLEWPALAELCIRLRARVCEVCGKEFVDNSRQLKARFCGKGCQSTSITRRKRGSHGKLLVVLQHEMERAREAVGAFCRSCAPEGVCWNDQCELRPVSPLPTHYGDMQVDVLDVTKHRRAVGLRELRRTRAQKRAHMQRKRATK